MQKYIETPRLILRDWKEEDIPFFARMNADQLVIANIRNKKRKVNSSLKFDVIQHMSAQRMFTRDKRMIEFPHSFHSYFLHYTF